MEIESPSDTTTDCALALGGVAVGEGVGVGVTVGVGVGVTVGLGVGVTLGTGVVGGLTTVTGAEPALEVDAPADPPPHPATGIRHA